MSGLILLAGIAAACSVADLDAEAHRALAAYEALDLDTFVLAASNTERLARCLEEPATPDAAWDLHVVTGLDAWVARNPDVARAAFRGARATRATADLSPRLAPEGSHARVLWIAAGVDGPGATSRTPPGHWIIDGNPDATALPVERAALVQNLTPDGRVVRTWYFPDGVDRAALRSPRRRPLLFAGGAIALGGGVAVATAGLLREVYVSAPLDEPRRGLVVANAVTGVLGYAALGVGATMVSVEALRW